MPHNPQSTGFQISGKLTKLMLFCGIFIVGICGFLQIQDLPRSQPESREVISPPPPPAYITLHRGEEIQLQIRESEWTPWLILPESGKLDLRTSKNGTITFGFLNGMTIVSSNREAALGRFPDRTFRLRGIESPAKFVIFP